MTHKMINSTYLKEITDGTRFPVCCLINLLFKRLDVLSCVLTRTYLISEVEPETLPNSRLAMVSQDVADQITTLATTLAGTCFKTLF